MAQPSVPNSNANSYTNATSNPAFSTTALRPSDAPALAVRIAAAFGNEALHQSWVAPVSPPAEREARVREFRIARLTHDALHPAPGTYCIVARRAGDDEAVGFAVWVAPCAGAGASGAQSSAVDADADADADAKAQQQPSATTHPIVLQHVRASIDATLLEMRARVWGSSGASDFWCLDALAVDPAAQGQGVGRMLVEWGCARADAEGKDAYLESSEAGLNTYRRAGFVEVTKERDGVDGWMDFEYGGRRCAMVRRAKVTTKWAT